MIKLNNGQSRGVCEVFGAFTFHQVLGSHHLGDARAPVIEITSNQQGRTCGHFSFNVMMQLLYLSRIILLATEQ